VLDYDHSSGAVDTRSVEAMLRAAKEAGYTIEFVLETHAHADHLSGAPVIKAMTGAKVGIGEHIKDVQRIFRPIFNATDLKTDGGDFDRLFRDGERFKIGELDLEVLYTPADVSYMIEDAVFFGGDAHKLYRSIKRLLALPPETRLFMCHDYKAPGRDTYVWKTTVRGQRENNIQAKQGITEDEFVAMREARDTKLSPPRLLLPSIQVNIRAGKFPPAEANGVHYLAIPVTLKGGAEACV